MLTEFNAVFFNAAFADRQRVRMRVAGGRSVPIRRPDVSTDQLRAVGMALLDEALQSHVDRALRWLGKRGITATQLFARRFVGGLHVQGKLKTDGDAVLARLVQRARELAVPGNVVESFEQHWATACKELARV